MQGSERGSSSPGGIRRPIDASLVAGVPVDDVTAEEALELIAWFIGAGRGSGRTFQIATVNVDFVVNAQHDQVLREILLRADLCVADGMPVVWYSKLKGVPLRERVTGADLVPSLVDRSREHGWRVLLFGSAPGVAEAAADLLVGRFPGASVHGISGPMLRDVAAMEQEWLDAITELRPDVICVALGNPKQEKWIEAFRSRLGVPVLIGVGGTLDFLVGGRRRAPDWMKRSGLEWVYRAAQEPGRLGRRYLRDAIVFAPHAARALWGRLREGKRLPRAWPATITGADVTVDLAGVEAGIYDLQALVAMARDARRAGGRVHLAGLTATTRQALDRMDVIKLFG